MSNYARVVFVGPQGMHEHVVPGDGQTTTQLVVPSGATAMQIQAVVPAGPAPPEPPPPAGFYEAVLGWLKRKVDPYAVEVTDVSGYGTDWEGDTEGGFYSTFAVTIRYRRGDGGDGCFDVQGETMDSLWRFVVNGWRPEIPRS